MQNTISEMITTRNTQHESDSSKIALLWMKNQPKESNPVTSLITIALAVLVIAFAFFQKDIFFRDLIASGLIMLMGGTLKWMDRPKQILRFEYYQNNLN